MMYSASLVDVLITWAALANYHTWGVGGLKMTEIYSLIVLEARSTKSKSTGPAVLGGSREEFFLDSF